MVLLSVCKILMWFTSDVFSSNYTYTLLLFFSGVFSKLMINNNLTNTVKLNCPIVGSPTPIIPPVYVSLFDVIIIWELSGHGGSIACGWEAASVPSEQQWMMTDWHPRHAHGCNIYTVKTLNMDDLMIFCHTLSWTKQIAAYSTWRQEDGNVFLLFHLRTEHMRCAKSKNNRLQQPDSI